MNGYHYTAKDLAEARRVANMTEFSVAEVLRLWRENEEHEARAEEALRDMFPLDDH